MPSLISSTEKAVYLRYLESTAKRVANLNAAVK